MLRNFLLVSLRNIKRDKIFSLINISGLAVGITCFLALFLFIQDELSFDKFTSSYKSDQIYRIFVKLNINGEENINSKTSGALGPLLQQNFPEVETYTRIGHFGPRAFRHDEKVLRSGSIYAVDSTFFKIFSLTFIEGNPATALAEPHSMVLTESASKRIFGDENPVGQMLLTDDGANFLVTGLVKDFPKNSHFRCDYLESLATYEVDESWMHLWYSTYIVLKEGANAGAFEAKLEKVVTDYVGPEAEAILGVPIEQFLNDGNAYGFYLQPFTSIYLHSQRDFGIDPNTEWGNIVTSDITYIYMLAAIALFILLLAVINFMNLATAQSERRAKEVGVRKTFGSSRFKLIVQFMGEAVIMSFLSMLLALILLSIFLPQFNSLVGKEMKLVIIDEPFTYPLLLGFVLMVGILAGSYPAFYLSSFRPSLVLKSNEGSESRKSMLRNGLVVVQFSISICLLIGTVVINQQLRYIQDKNLGFNKEHLLLISNTDVLGHHIETFKGELLKNPRIIALTNASRMFSTGVPGNGYLFNKKSGTDPILCQVVDVDYDFLETYQIALQSGRFFSKEFPADEQAVVVNEAAVRSFQTDDALDKELVSLEPGDRGHSYKIIGVIKDFNYESLHRQVRPLVLHLHTPWQPSNVLTIRMASDEMGNTLSYIEETWKKFAAEGYTIHYNFIDATLARLYETEKKTNTVSMIFSSLAIFIACIGLFGLAAFVTAQRTKEIGIRKVLGASSTQIALLLSKEFAIWVLISNILAWPVAYFVMKDWLSNFAFRVDLSVGVFVLSGVITFLIAFITVSYHTLKAADVNPVQSLKYE